MLNASGASFHYGARGSYDRAMNQLVSGKGNLIKQTAEFKELGVAVKKELPAELVDRARLELDSGAADDARDAAPQAHRQATP